MIKITAPNATKLDKYLKTVYYEGLNYSVCVKEINNKINFIIDLDVNENKIIELISKYHYNDMIYIVE